MCIKVNHNDLKLREGYTYTLSYSFKKYGENNETDNFLSNFYVTPSFNSYCAIVDKILLDEVEQDITSGKYSILNDSN